MKYNFSLVALDGAGQDPIIVEKADVFDVSVTLKSFIEAALAERGEDVDDEEPETGEVESKGNEEEETETETIEIFLPGVNRDILLHVVEFFKLYRKEKMNEIPKPLPWPKRVLDLVQADFARYIYTRPYELIFEIIAASNYLDIETLLELCMLRVARNLVNKTADMIHKDFNMKEPFTEEEARIILENNKWTTVPTEPSMMAAEPAELIQEKLGVTLAV